ncbi:MAG: PilN domain-containing protein [Ignavibacteria bacterium]|nr:PilN domain-containing protein [Ignavibacteria bacterium]
MKIFAGIFQDGLEIKIAFLKKTGKRLQVQKLLSVPSSERHFVYTSQNSSVDLTDENFDFEEIKDSAQPQTQLTEIINYYPLESLRFVPVITEPQISYLVYNPIETKKNLEIKNELKKLWKETINIDIPLNKIDFIEYKNHSFVSSYIQEDIPILKELSELARISEIKTLEILPLRSGDISLINYVFRRYHPSKDEHYLVIHIGVESIRLLFLKDEKIIHINRYLSINFERQGLVSFISSKIVLEMEYAGVTEISKIILTGEVNDELLHSFRQSFPFIDVELLDLELFDLNQLSEEDKIKLQSFSFPLVSVFDELFPYREIRKNLDVHSKRLSKISLIKKIDFVSIFLFFFLFALLFISANKYLERKKHLEALKEHLHKIEMIRAASPEELKLLDSLNREFEILNTYHSNVENFLNNHLWWTDELININSFNLRKNKIWLTSFTIDEKNPNQIIIKGLTLDRAKVPNFMTVLKNPELKNIYLYEIRGKKIFQFEITASVGSK